MIGRNLSHYEVLEELGRGGMGVVYKARDTRLKRYVALKVLSPKLAENPDRIALLRREAEASAGLNHPRIVTIYSIEEAAGHLFMTMEYVEGRSLDKAIPKGGFDLDRFLKIAIPLADALGAAHEQGIVHRDLKPGNIILSKEDRPKILDFGLARLRPEESAEPDPASADPVDSVAATQMETLEGKLVGTVPYMSPEQLSRGPIDHRTDIFSLGVVFYEMATGRHPYSSDGGGAVISSILQEDPASVADVRSHLPRQLGRILRHCLEKDPKERAQSAIDLRNDLRDLTRELASPDSRGARSRGRRPRLVLAATLALSVLAAGAWLLSERFRGDPAAPPSPYHLSVQGDRIFPGDRGPEYFREGVLDTLNRQLRGLSGIYVVTDDGPNPDITIVADVRRTGETVGIGFRVLDSRLDLELGSAALEGRPEALFDLLEQAAHSIAEVVDRKLDLAVGFRPAKPPTDDMAAFDLYLRALRATREKAQPADPTVVHELLEQAVARDPGFAWAWLLQGQTYLAQHRAAPDHDLASRAETHCQTAAELDATLGAAHTCIGELLTLQERTLDAVAAYRQALEVDTSDLTPHYGLREAYLKLGLPENAEQDWQRLIRSHPGYWAVHYSLGTYYQDLERYEEARQQYLRALQLAPRNADVHAYLGTVHFYLGRFEEATVALQESIDIRPTWDAYYNLGGIYYSLRRFEPAVAAFEEAVQLAGSEYEPHGRLGWACYWAPGRRDEAPGHLRRAIAIAQRQLEKHPEDSDALILTAVFQAIVGDRQPSLESLDRAMELRPNDPHYFYLAGLAANHLGDTDSAVEWLQRAARGGYSIAEMRNIVDLDNLHSDPRFQQLLREAATNHL